MDAKSQPVGELFEGVQVVEEYPSGPTKSLKPWPASRHDELTEKCFVCRGPCSTDQSVNPSWPATHRYGTPAAYVCRSCCWSWPYNLFPDLVPDGHENGGTGI